MMLDTANPAFCYTCKQCSPTECSAGLYPGFGWGQPYTIKRKDKLCIRT